MILFGPVALVGEGSGKEAGLQAREPAHAPLGVGDLADKFEFEGVGGLDVGFEGRKLAVEVGGVLAGQDGIAGEESMFEGVLCNAGFALLGARSGRFLLRCLPLALTWDRVAMMFPLFMGALSG